MSTQVIMAADAAIPPPAEIIKQKALSIQERAAAIQIRDQPSYDGAVELVRGVKALRKEVEDHHRPGIEAAHNAHKVAVATLKKIDDPLAEAERDIKGKIGAWDAEQERIRQAEARRIQAEQERLAAEAMEQQIEQMEAAGSSAAEVAAVIDQAAFMPAMAAAPIPTTYEKAKGVSASKRYVAEVTDILALVRFVAANPVVIDLITINMVALNQRARSQGAALRIPGVRVVEQRTVSVR